MGTVVLDMDNHGVDVSWLHRPCQARSPLRSAATLSQGLLRAVSSPTSGTLGSAASPDDKEQVENQRLPKIQTEVPAPAPAAVPRSPKRPSLLGRTSGERLSTIDTNSGRRTSWMSSIGSKFSSPQQQGQQSSHDSLSPLSTTASKQRDGNFLSSLTRRMSSGTNASRKAIHGPSSPRVTLNVDRGRVRCALPELHNTTLKRVAFSVDVEVAGPPRYEDDESLSGDTSQHKGADEHTPNVGVPSHKKEKKKRSEEERKERNQQRRKKQEDSGSIPVELSMDGRPRANSSMSDNATTEPVRVYRRCCQLRESPILKRITEQLMSPACLLPERPGTVALLDLTGSRMQQADVVTLADWLAIVPVKRLVLEDADLSDDGVRSILAGLLASKIPRPTKVQHLGAAQALGAIEKLTLRNNPRLTSKAWGHISLFVHMCRSIRVIDLSMLTLPLQSTTLFCKALSERPAGPELAELNLSDCRLSPEQVREILGAVATSGVSRLGLAGIDLDGSLDSVTRYISSGKCTALDLSGTDLSGEIGKLAHVLTPECPLWALSVASCDLDASALDVLLKALETLPDFRFVDFSHNPKLGGAEDAIDSFREYIPRMRQLKRLHLGNIGLDTPHAIAIAEILPESSSLAHVNLLENTSLSELITKTDEVSQEEACALYASLMSAARVSKTMVSLDIDVPPAETSEVIKSLAKQTIAYCLRNMGQIALDAEVTEVVPDVLGQLDDMAPDSASIKDDYLVGGSGIAKALQYCLGRDHTDTASRPCRAKDMSKNLLDSARRIHARLQPALVRESTAGDSMAYRRLLFLDTTLRGLIQRFEDEYPETRLRFTNTENAEDIAEDARTPRTSRQNSDVNLASRVLSQEEGRLHRLSQTLRRDILKTEPTEASKPELPDLARGLEGYTGDHLRELIAEGGFDRVLEHAGINIGDIRRIAESDPTAWEQFRESQLTARLNHLT